MNDAENETGDFFTDEKTEYLISDIIDSVKVTMSSKDFLTGENFLEAVRVNFNSQIFLKKVTKPEIMIAGYEYQATAAFPEIRQDFQHREVIFDDYSTPAEPKIKNIAIQDQNITFTLQAFQETYNSGSSLFLCLIGIIFEVEIRYKNYSHICIYWVKR